MTKNLQILLITFTLTLNIYSQAVTGTTTITQENMANCKNLVVAPWQGQCAADWAIAVTGAIQRQLCIKKSLYNAINISYQDLICNCQDCHIVKGNGCMGGKVDQAFSWLKSNGPVGGAQFGMTQALPAFNSTQKAPLQFKNCLNYYADECYNINIPNTKQCQQSQKAFDSSMNCPTKCTYTANVNNQTFAASRQADMLPSAPTVLSKFAGIKKGLEGAQNVLVGFMEIYEDIFYAQKDQVYIHTTGQSLGIHAIQILGYVEDNTTGLNYWQVLLPFGKEVAEGGVVRVLAGINHCNIEERAYKFDVKISY